MPTLSHWINGQTVTASTDTRLGDITNPATGVVSGQVALGSKATVESAITAAAEAFPAWRDTSLAKRTSVLFAFRELLNARKQELAEIITAEHGKVVSDALGEVARGQEVVEFACGIAAHLKGGHTQNASTNVDVHSLRQPLGVAAIISPFNFPAMVPMWFFPVAIAAGNTVVLKPSEKDPTAANWIAELWKEAGLPDGVFNVVHGDKEAVDTLLTSPEVASVSFVGSTPIAKYVYENGTAAGKRVQALGGAKNHMLVLPDADLDLAADAAVNAGYGAAGERCMAISVVVAVDSIADELVARIAERTRTLRIGDGRGEPDMGPLVTAAHRDKVSGYIDAGVEAGASSSSTDASTTTRTASSSTRPCSTRSRPICRSTPTRSSAPCSPSSASPATTKDSTSSTPIPTATAPRSSPMTAVRPGATRTRSRSAWSASTSRSPCRWATTPSADGRTRCSATPTPTAKRESTSSPAARS
jgi:malonate-semialdehyde dehydrogenase (acetylating)/methylmalonate-semialdehyde dehydrogenase